MVYLAPTYLIPFQVFGPTLWVSQQCDGARGQFAAERVRGSRQVQHLSTRRANSDVAAPRNRPPVWGSIPATEVCHKTVGRTSARGLSCHAATLTNWLLILQLSSGATWRLSQDFVLEVPLPSSIDLRQYGNALPKDTPSRGPADPPTSGRSPARDCRTVPRALLLWWIR